MKITYISHATLLIEAEGKKLVTDPWVKGSSYCDQWFLFPKPLGAELIQDADFVLYSHGHEDHLHAESLATIHQSAEIYYPYSWYGGTTEFFNEMGFHNVHEIMTEQTRQLAKNIHVTYLSNNLDNVIVLEINGTVIVNVNDALPSASAPMIAHFISKIKKKWKKIDYVFSSYGGASYFPNTVHYKNKNDKEIAETRELFFVTNFCKIVAGLEPRYAIPFASDFILLDQEQRWINETKFPRDQIKAFYHTFTKGTSYSEVIEAYPNDYFENGLFHKNSPYHEKKAARPLLSTLDEDYKSEIAAKLAQKKLTQEETALVFEKTKKHILAKKYIIPETIRNKIKFAIRLRDGEEAAVLTIDFRNEANLFSEGAAAGEGLDLLIDLRSKTLLYAIENEWGGDAIIIGYGAEIFIYKEDAVLKEYENYCVRLLSRYPNTKEYLKRSPFRAMKYLLSDDIKRKNLLNKALGKREKVMEYTETLLGKRDLWLNKSKCDVCKACNL